MRHVTLDDPARLSLLQAMADHAPILLWMSGIGTGRTFLNKAWLNFTGRTIAEQLGDGWIEGMHEEDRAASLEIYREAVEAKRPFQTEYRLLRADGSYRWLLDRGAPQYGSGGFAGYVGSAVDITTSITSHAPEELYADPDLSLKVIHLLAENAPDMIYRYRMHPTRATEYMSPGALKLTGHRPQEFYADPDLQFKILHPDDQATARRMMTAPEQVTQPVILRWCHPDGSTVFAEHCLIREYGPDGRLVAIEGVGRNVTERLAVETRLRNSESQLRQLAASLQSSREEERTYLARELHDELGQTLTSLKLELTRTAQALSDIKICPGVIDRLQSMIGLADLSTESVRRIATALRPPALDHLGLPAAIELEAAAFERRTGIRCRMSVGKEPLRIDDQQSTTLFRIFQEALTNVARHASASTVRVTLRQGARVFRMDVRDNGRGISKQELASPQSIGLVGMRERAQILGGQAVITSHRGKGTTLTVSIPLELLKGKGARRSVSGARSHATRASRR